MRKEGCIYSIGVTINERECVRTVAGTGDGEDWKTAVGIERR